MIGLSTPPEPDYSEFVEVDPTGRYGRYNEILGKGASKTVYRGFDEYEGIEVAWNQVKLYDFLQSPQDLERLYCEIHLLKTLKHKNIMKFYTSWVDTTKRNINFVTEMFTSGTLRQYRQKHKRVNIRAVKHWCRQILKGLLYLHSHDPPVIHRDLKCDNIFVNGNQGEVKIGDLGLAAILRKSHAAHCVGTPEFMAPEVYEEEYNELVDIYSFGMCILEMVTLEYPYSECTHPAQIYKKVISGKKPDALYKVKDPELRQFVEKCLVTVSQRLPARDLLKDPFLQIDNCSSDSRLVDCWGDIDEISPLWRQPLLERDHNCSSLINCYSNHLSQETENGWDYDADVIGPHGIDFFHNHEDEHLANVDITIKGKMGDDMGIFLRLRIADKEGHIRNIYFPFDIETDTALSVATEMVAELDITDQDVTKIAEMIDNEISSLVSGWKPGPGIEEAPAYSALNFCHHCTSNGSSSGSLHDFLSTSNPDSKNIQGLHCPHLGCTAMHGRFEEITYQVEGSEQCAINGPPVVSSQSDGLHADVSAQYEAPYLCMGGSGQAHSDEECEKADKPTLAEVETIKHMDNHIQSNARRSVNQLSCTTLNHTQLTDRSSVHVSPSAFSGPDDYDKEIRQELRWLKAKYQMELRDVRNQRLGGSQKASGPSRATNHSKNSTKNGPMVSSVWTQSQEENDELLLKSFASGMLFSSCFPTNDSRDLAPINSSPGSETQRVRHCEATQEHSPDYMFTAKSFYTGALLPQSLHRTKSLPVDAVDA